MDFEPTKQQQMIVDSVAQFVRNESNVDRFRAMRDTERGWDPEVWKRMADYGWLAIAFRSRSVASTVTSSTWP